MERQTYYDYPNWSSSPDESHDIVYEWTSTRNIQKIFI
jgi:hypothetical protein